MNSSAPLVFAGGPQGWWAGGGAGLPVLLPVLLGGLCVASSLGNLLLLAALAHQLRRGRLSPGHALLINLAASDLVLALACLPARIATYARRSWALGAVLCRTSDWLLQGCLVAKSLTWAAVGEARSRQLAASSPPASPGRAWGGKRLAGLLTSAWTAALLLPLPHLLFARLEGRGTPGGLLRCLFRPPPGASGFLAVYSKVYPLAACLGPAAFAAACSWRARRRLQKAKKNRLGHGGRPPPRPGPPGLLGGLALLFHATWLPLWVAWLWERHRAPGPRGPPPPPDLVFAAEGLLFLDGALSPALLLGLSPEVRDGLKSLRRALRCRQEGGGGGGGGGGEQEAEAAAGVSRGSLGTKPDERPQALGDLPREAAERVLPDVEHFWKDRRDTTAGEESDPVPWEHQSGP